MLTVYAPAKINLVLEILAIYDDAYHQISSILQTVSLYDVLKFQLAEGIAFKCSELNLEYNNLVIRAAMLIKRTMKCNKGVRIELHKNIPWGVGLGGGSSDAAAVLLTLNKLWNLNLSVTELACLAFKLGSDVPFFVYGGTALVEGKGEKITPLPSLYPAWFVLLVPPVLKIQDKTRQLYGQLNSSYFTRGEFVHAALPPLMRSKQITPDLMFNVFEKVAMDFFPQLDEYKYRFGEAGASNVNLAGSGPCLFTLVYSEDEAKRLYLRLRRQGLECYVASSLSVDS